MCDSKQDVMQYILQRLQDVATLAGKGWLLMTALCHSSTLRLAGQDEALKLDASTLFALKAAQCHHDARSIGSV